MDVVSLRLETKKLQRDKLKAAADVARLQYKITELEFKIADRELEREMAQKDGRRCDCSYKKRRRERSESSDSKRQSKQRKLFPEESQINTKHNPLENIQAAPQSTPKSIHVLPKCISPLAITPEANNISKPQKECRSKKKLDMDLETKTNKAEQANSLKNATLTDTVIKNATLTDTVIKNATLTDTVIKNKQAKTSVKSLQKVINECNKVIKYQEYIAKSLNRKPDVVKHAEERMVCHIPLQLIGRHSYKKNGPPERPNGPVSQPTASTPGSKLQ